MWNYETFPPSTLTIFRYTNVKNMKWYINTHTDELLKGYSWNSDFLMGVLQWGKVHYNLMHFPSFFWYGNENLVNILQSSPFYGEINKSYKTRWVWFGVPALCFKYSTASIDYMAGVLSTGIVKKHKDKVLVGYNKNVGVSLRNWGIPIEAQEKPSIFISPFWPVILKNHMPESLRQKWEYVPHAYKAKEYSSILWRIYTGKDSVSEKIPYLLSRRTIFNKYGSLKALRDMWISNQLVELDLRFKKVIQEWQEKTV